MKQLVAELQKEVIEKFKKTVLVDGLIKELVSKATSKIECKYSEVQIKRDGVVFELYCVNGRFRAYEDEIELPEMDIALFYTLKNTTGLTAIQKRKLREIRNQLDDSRTWYVSGENEKKFGILYIREIYSISIETLLGEVNLEINGLILNK